MSAAAAESSSIAAQNCSYPGNIPAPRTNPSTGGNSSSPSAHESTQSEPPSASRILPSSDVCRTVIRSLEVEVVILPPRQIGCATDSCTYVLIYATGGCTW